MTDAEKVLLAILCANLGFAMGFLLVKMMGA